MSSLWIYCDVMLSMLISMNVCSVLIVILGYMYPTDHRLNVPVSGESR